jgi:hypothetical protein
MSLHQGRALDSYEPPEVVAAARALDPEHAWQDIPDEKIEQLGNALGYLDPEGFRFYIPRFMLFDLRDAGPSNSATFAVSDALHAADVPETSAPLALLSPEQRSVLRDFVQFFRGP